MTARAQLNPGFPIDRNVPKLACPNVGEVRASIDGKLICVRPVVGLDAEEQRRVPRCGAGQTLVRSADGRFFCFDGSLNESAKPVCFNGGSPIRKADGSFVCRRTATDAGKPDLEITLLEKHGCTVDVPGSFRCPAALNSNIAPQVGGLQVRVRNIGARDSEETRLVFGFPANAPFKGSFTFFDPSRFCPGRLVPPVDLTPICISPDGYALASSRTLSLTAEIVVPRLAPRAQFESYTLIIRSTPMAVFPKTDLVNRMTVFARVNDGRAFDELDFGNNEVVVDIRLRD